MSRNAIFRRGPILALFLATALGGCEKQVESEMRAPVERTAISQQAAEPSLVQTDSSAGIAPLVRGARGAYEQNSVDVFKALAPSVVHVTNKRLQQPNRWSRPMIVEAGAGTGFVWDKEGHIVTNFHVVDKGRAFEVRLYDGTVLPAKFVGGDPKKDIAVLKIVPPKNLTPIPLPPTQQAVEVGQKAIAIGNPFGFDHTLTVGVISAIGREMRGFANVTIRDMLQTDASINPGNSGGPLLDSQGFLIGMNTMISSKSGGSSGVGFAVPVAAVRRVVPDVIRFGQVKRAGLGVQLLSDQKARANGIDGVIIETVQRGTPAAKAGLQGIQRRRGQDYLGDTIIGINAFPVKNFDQLYNALDRFKAGDTVTVVVRRANKNIKVSLKLMELK